MDWAKAIERNSKALNAIVAALFAMLGLVGDATVSRISQPLYNAVLRVLRPAESAVRRLIIIVARGLVVKLAPKRPAPAGPIGKGGGSKRPSFPFQLFDPRKNFAAPRRKKLKRNSPRIYFFGDASQAQSLWPARPPEPDPPPPDGLVGAEGLSRRLQALKLALSDLPRQAKRLARWRQKREKAPSPKFRSPLRPGPPPGHRKKPNHEVDQVLSECHGLAFEAMRPNTS